jgi:hypothetical protein
MSTNDPRTRTFDTGTQVNQENERQRNQGTSPQNLSDQVRETTHQAQETAKTMLASQKVYAAEGLNSLAQALRQTGQSLRQQDQETIAHYATRVADQVNSLSATLRDKDFDEIVQDMEDFARRRPEVVLGGAVAVGFLLARFLKSHSPQQQMYGDYGPTYGRAYDRYQTPSAQGYGRTTGQGRQHEHRAGGAGHSPYQEREREPVYQPREQSYERSTQPTRPDLGRRTREDE